MLYRLECGFRYLGAVRKTPSDGSSPKAVTSKYNIKGWNPHLFMFHTHTHLIPFRQSQGGGVSILLTCLCFQMSCSCCRSAVSIPPGCSVLRTAQHLHQLTATCGLPAAGSSVPTPPTRMGLGTLLTAGHPTALRLHAAREACCPCEEREEALLD